MIIGALAISFAVAPDAEQRARQMATNRECERYGLPIERVEAALTGSDPLALEAPGRRWWDGMIVVTALGIFVSLTAAIRRLPFIFDLHWTAVLAVILLGSLFVCGFLLWRRTRFS